MGGSSLRTLMFAYPENGFFGFSPYYHYKLRLFPKFFHEDLLLATRYFLSGIVYLLSSISYVYTKFSLSIKASTVKPDYKWPIAHKNTILKGLSKERYDPRAINLNREKNNWAYPNPCCVCPGVLIQHINLGVSRAFFSIPWSPTHTPVSYTHLRAHET